MVEIFSKRDGPRAEDVQIRRVIEQNRGLITKLADHLSNGQYSNSKKPRATPQAEGLIVHIGGSPAAAPEPEARIRVTPNGRIIAVDVHSGRQLLHFGDIRATGNATAFKLATADNRYVAPLDDDIVGVLADMDGVSLGAAYSAADLAADIGRRVDIAPEA